MSTSQRYLLLSLSLWSRPSLPSPSLQPPLASGSTCKVAVLLPLLVIIPPLQAQPSVQECTAKHAAPNTSHNLDPTPLGPLNNLLSYTVLSCSVPSERKEELPHATPTHRHVQKHRSPSFPHPHVSSAIRTVVPNITDQDFPVPPVTSPFFPPPNAAARAQASGPGRQG